MLVKDFITKEIPVLKSFDTGEYALTLMDDYKLKHLPVVSDNSLSIFGGSTFCTARNTPF